MRTIAVQFPDDLYEHIAERAKVNLTTPTGYVRRLALSDYWSFIPNLPATKAKRPKAQVSQLR